MSSVLNWLIFSKLVAFKKTALTCLQTVGPPQRNTLRCLYQKQTFIKKIYCIVFIKKTQAKHMALSLSKATTRKHMALFIYQIFFGSDKTYQICHTKTFWFWKSIFRTKQAREICQVEVSGILFAPNMLLLHKIHIFKGRSIRLKFPGSCRRQSAKRCCFAQNLSRDRNRWCTL